MLTGAGVLHLGGSGKGCVENLFDALQQRRVCFLVRGCDLLLRLLRRLCARKARIENLSKPIEKSLIAYFGARVSSILWIWSQSRPRV